MNRVLWQHALLCKVMLLRVPDHRCASSALLRDYVATLSFGCFFYCGCFNLFCTVWVFLVICILVFTVFCIVCTVFLLLCRLGVFSLIRFVCTSVRTTATE